MRFLWSVILIGGCIFAGCGSIGEGWSVETWTVTDDTGIASVIPKRPMRIVSVGASTDDIVMALVPSHRIAAISAIPHSDEKAEAHIEGRVSMTAESVMVQVPDLVIAGDWSSAEWVQSLRDLGISVYVYRTPSSWEDTKALIGKLAFVTDSEEEGMRLIRAYEQREGALRHFTDALPEDGRLRAAAYTVYGFTGGAGSTIDDVYRLAGLHNAVSAAGGYSEGTVNGEAVLANNPQIIFMPSDAYDRDGYRAEKAEALYDNPAYQNMDAVKYRQVHVIDARYLYSYSQYMLHGAEDMARAAYGYEP